MALLGPSGCGKTTTLRLVAGFLKPTEGRILIGERDVTNVAPERRKTGLVFQSYALFPHMTVTENVMFGLRAQRVPRAECTTRAANVIERVGLGGFGTRYPRELSGGQQQRAALARTLVINPEVLLLDEPLANLDTTLRDDMLVYIKALQEEFATTTLYVTHDQEEALALADRIAVIIDGRLQQVDEPEVIHRHPNSALVARYTGRANVLPGVVRATPGPWVHVETPAGSLACASGVDLAVGTACNVVIRPADCEMVNGRGPKGANQLRGTVTARAFLGGNLELQLELGGQTRLRVDAPWDADVTPGDDVTVAIRPEHCWGVADR